MNADKLYSLLCQLQWTGHNYNDEEPVRWWCYICRYSEQDGHSETCELNKAINELSNEIRNNVPASKS